MILNPIKSILKILLVIVCAAIIGLGCYYAVIIYKTQHSRSETWGVADKADPYENFDFYTYDFTKEISFSSNGTTRSYTQTIPVSLEFDGEQNKFNVLINDSPCETTQSTFGIVAGTFELYFQNTDGTISSTLSLNYKITVFVSSIKYEFWTEANDDDFANLLTYVQVSGFKVRIIDEQYRKTAVSTFTPLALTNIDIGEIPLANGNGKAVELKNLTITYNNNILTKDRDYSVSYQNNKTYGYAVATITGIGHFTGAVVKEFIVDGVFQATLPSNKMFSFGSTNDEVLRKTFSVPEMNGKAFKVKFNYKLCQQLIWRTEWENYSITLQNGVWKTFDDHKFRFVCRTEGVLTLEYATTLKNAWWIEITLEKVLIDQTTTSSISGHEESIPRTSPPPLDPDPDELANQFSEPKQIELSAFSTFYEVNIAGLDSTKNLQITAKLCSGNDEFNLTSTSNEFLLNGKAVKIDFYCFENGKLFIQLNANSFGVFEDTTIEISNITQTQGE